MVPAQPNDLECPNAGRLCSTNLDSMSAWLLWRQSGSFPLLSSAASRVLEDLQNMIRYGHRKGLVDGSMLNHPAVEGGEQPVCRQVRI
jgi:hypothetical protein